MSSFFEKSEINIKQGVSTKEKLKISENSNSNLETKNKEKLMDKKEWFNKPKGQLVVDVYRTEKSIVIQSAIAGVKIENLDISVENDMVIIKGIREKPEETEERSYFCQECYWGPFSREIILSEEIDPGRAEAIMKDGILTLRFPRIQRNKKVKIEIKSI